MIESLGRRNFLGLGAAMLASRALPESTGTLASQSVQGSFFPLQDPALVREMVLVAHGKADRVKELLMAHPALARAAIDWGYGDWESALGAASHMGRRDIAEMLLANGARPSIFSAAMLGQIEVVRAFVSASPGVQRTLGPHSITLLVHARAGGPSAKVVMDYLTSLGDADQAPPTISLDASMRDRYLGSYAFGPELNERLVVALNGEFVTLQRPGFAYRIIRPVAPNEFHPVGAEAVRIRFKVLGSEAASAVEVYDSSLVVTATRVAG